MNMPREDEGITSKTGHGLTPLLNGAQMLCPDGLLVFILFILFILFIHVQTRIFYMDEQDAQDKTAAKTCGCWSSRSRARQMKKASTLVLAF
jgi:hypothetical protein